MRRRTEKPPPSSSIVMRVNKLRITRNGAIHVHGVGTLWMSDEARGQLGLILGMKIEAGLPRAESTEHAQSVNEKLARVPKDVRVRVAWRWTTAERTNCLTEPEGIVTGIEVVATSTPVVMASAPKRLNTMPIPT